MFHLLLALLAASLPSEWKPDRAELMRHQEKIAAYCLSPGDAALDVGCNWGDWSILFSRLVGPTGRVIAYECHPYIVASIAPWLPHQGEHNILLKTVAASSTTGEFLTLQFYPYDTWSCRATVEPLLMIPERMPGKTERAPVPTEALAELLQDSTLPPIRLIRLDVEGHESSVLTGAIPLLELYRPLLLLDYLHLPGKFETTSIAQLEALRYICYHLRTNQRVTPGFISPETVLLAIPEERDAEIAPLLPTFY